MTLTLKLMFVEIRSVLNPLDGFVVVVVVVVVVTLFGDVDTGVACVGGDGEIVGTSSGTGDGVRLTLLTILMNICWNGSAPLVPPLLS